MLVKILSHLAVDEQLLGTKLLGILERKIVLKDKLASYFWFHEWQPSNHKELLVFLGLLTMTMGLMNMSRHESLLENQRLVLKAQQLLAPIFIKDRLLMLQSMLHFTENEGDSSILVSYLDIIECHNKIQVLTKAG